MKSFIHRNPIRWLVILIGGILLLFIIDFGLRRYIESKIYKTLLSINGKADAVHVNLSRRFVKISGLQIAADSSQHSLQLKTVSARGISIFNLLMNKRIVVNEVLLDSGTVAYKSPNQNQSKPTFANNTFIRIKKILFHNMLVHLETDTTERFSAILNGQLTETTLEIDSVHSVHYAIKSIEARAEKVVVWRAKGMYSGTIGRLQINTNTKEIIIDSAKLIPNHGKYEFAKLLGKQTARLDLSIPQLTIKGLQFSEIADSAFVASKIEIKTADLFVFKDKRIPFLKKENVPLPMDSFLKLPFRVKVDSIVISNSLITVEEFPENGAKTGIITFADINATIAGLDNRQKESVHPYALLNASGLLMGTGKIKALFQLPLDGSSIYTAAGSVSNMSFKELNPILTPMANVSVESGFLKNLKFDFKYNDFTSKGNINIDYNNLQFMSLNTDRRSTNEIKTFFMNALVRNDRSKSIAPTQKNGVIDIARDRKRYIFNVWWRSILDGLKSAILR